MYIKKFWESVSEDWRHFSSGPKKMKDNKKKYIINNVNKHIFSKINKDEIETTLDWGCGGGILSKEISNFSKVGIVDLTKTSLDNAKKYLGEKNYLLDIELPNDISKYTYDGPKVDLVFCHAVIQHFPTINYFEKVLSVWEDINPKYIAIQIKLGNETKECKNYEKEFLNGLFFSEDDIIKYFNDINYKNISIGYSKTLNNKIKLGYYVFKK
jgi:2-polyprenyl-3-methyl-5-hydroxy-6-metoxy-1,4-benzoquinol methylase